MNLLEQSDDKILTIINPIMDNLMDASTEINYQKHIKDFSLRILNHISSEGFEEMCKDYQNKKGFFTNRQFIFLFKRESSIAVVWKQSFTKVKGDFIAEAIFIEENNKVVVDHVLIL